MDIMPGAPAVDDAQLERDARFRSAFHDAAVGMVIVSPGGHCLDINASFCNLLGYSAAELLATDFQQLTYPSDLENALRHFERICAGELVSYQLETRYLHRDGRIVWGQLSVSAVRQEGGRLKYLLGQIHDVTARKHYEAHIEVLAYRDELTNLYNRRYFFEYGPSRLTLVRQAGQRTALLYLDLNGFKQINDTFGHRTGDELLRQVARGFQDTIREGDLVARLSGDEFAVLLFDVDVASVQHTVKRLIASVKQPFARLCCSAQCGVSIGVVIVSQSANSLDALLAQADGAMYRAKARKALEPYAVEVVRLGLQPEPY